MDQYEMEEKMDEPQKHESPHARDLKSGATMQALLNIQGVCAEIGLLPPETWIFEEGLANILKKSRASIQRAVKRGDRAGAIESELNSVNETKR